MEANASQAYRGYLLRYTIHGWTISKQGQHIAWATSVDEAKATVRLLTAEEGGAS
jgi:hypothetical protein